LTHFKHLKQNCDFNESIHCYYFGNKKYYKKKEVVVAFEPASEPEPELVPGLVLELELVPVMKKKNK
jgi:predicted nucleic acid-binding protein